MSLQILVISKDNAWQNWLVSELQTRGFRDITLLPETPTPALDSSPTADVILFDLGGLDQQSLAQVTWLKDNSPLSEWILLHDATATCKPVHGLNVYDLLLKSASIDQLALAILAACMRKERAQQRLQELKSTTFVNKKTD